MIAQIVILTAQLSEILVLLQLAAVVGIPLILITAVFTLCTYRKMY